MEWLRLKCLTWLLKIVALQLHSRADLQADRADGNQNAFVAVSMCTATSAPPRMLDPPDATAPGQTTICPVI